MRSEDRTLLVLLDGADKVPAERVSKVLSGDCEVTLLAVSQHVMSQNVLIENLGIQNTSTLDFSAMLEKVVSNEGNRLSDSLSQLHAVCADLWAARFTELNFSDPVWRDYLISRTLREIIYDQAGSYDQTILLGGSRQLQAAVQNMCPVPLNFIGHFTLNDWLRCLFEPCRHLFYWFRNCLNEVGAALAGKLNRYLRSEKSETSPKILIYCNYPSNWSYDYCPQYRFTGKMTDFLVPGVTAHYVVSAIHSNNSMVRGVRSTIKACARLRSRYEISILQEYAHIRDVWDSYIARPDMVRWNCVQEWLAKIGLEFKLNSIKRRYKWVDQPKQHALYRTMGRYLDAHPSVSQLLLPIFELAEGRAVALAARERGIEVIGLQHGAAGPYGSWRLLSAVRALKRADSCALPNSIAVEGPLYERIFRNAGFDHVHVTGAPRIRLLPERVEAPISDGGSVIFVLLDMHHWRVLTDWALYSAVREPKIRFVVRSHPRRYQEVLEYCDGKGVHNINFTLDSFPRLAEAVSCHLPSAIVAAETGAVIEFALAGWPCFLFSSGIAQQMSPLSWYSNTVRSVTWETDSIRNLVSLVNSPESKLYVEKLRECAKQSVLHYGERADSDLASLLRG